MKNVSNTQIERLETQILEGFESMGQTAAIQFVNALNKLNKGLADRVIEAGNGTLVQFTWFGAIFTVEDWRDLLLSPELIWQYADEINAAGIMPPQIQRVLDDFGINVNEVIG